MQYPPFPDDFAAFIGLDWADTKHDICLQAAGCETREASVLAHKPESIDEWARDLRQRGASTARAHLVRYHGLFAPVCP